MTSTLSITPSHILEYLFCPRFTYFEYVLGIPQHEEKFYKVLKGREVHKEKAQRHTEYLRKRLGVSHKESNVYLTGNRLRGEVDEVLTLEDGSMAPLDYKFAKYEDKLYETYKTQLICYALLIEFNYQKPVHKGFLVYTRSKNKLIEVDLTPKDKDSVNEVIDQIGAIIEGNRFPRATRYKKKCVNCTYKNICIR